MFRGFRPAELLERPVNTPSAFRSNRARDITGTTRSGTHAFATRSFPTGFPIRRRAPSVVRRRFGVSDNTTRATRERFIYRYDRRRTRDVFRSEIVDFSRRGQYLVTLLWPEETRLSPIPS